MGEYRQHLKAGPLPGQIDPWAEVGRYHQQIHAGMISELMGCLSDSLIDLGYVTSRESSLQIAENRQPDIAGRQFATNVPSTLMKTTHYVSASQEALAEAGVAAEWDEPELEALYIKDFATGDLVTIVEIVSPRNKTESRFIDEYVRRREHLSRSRGSILLKSTSPVR